MNTCNFKNLPALWNRRFVFAFFYFLKTKIADPTGNFFKIVCIQLPLIDRRARININATHEKKQAVFENPNTVLYVGAALYYSCKFSTLVWTIGYGGYRY